MKLDCIKSAAKETTNDNVHLGQELYKYIFFLPKTKQSALALKNPRFSRIATCFFDPTE
jgi:hypothetical protein